MFNCKLLTFFVVWTIITAGVTLYSYQAGVKSCANKPIVTQLTASPSLVPTTVSSSPTPSPDVTSQEVEIYYNGNIAGVQNSPTSPTTFTISSPHLIKTLQNYHWNNAKGSTPGTISLKDDADKTYGPWETTGSPGQGGVPNAYWTAKPEIVLPAGSYTVIDSEPSTWAQNSGNNHQGMTRITGIPK